MREYNNLRYYLNEDFPSPGVTFVDFTPTLYSSELINKVTDELIELIDEDIDYIVAPDARGFLWGMALANKLGIGLIPVRKKGKLPTANIQESIEYKTEYSSAALDLPIVDLKGKKTLFVDDVYATGGTFVATRELVIASGGTMDTGVVLYNVMLDDNKNIKQLVTSEDILK